MVSSMEQGSIASENLTSAIDSNGFVVGDLDAQFFQDLQSVLPSDVPFDNPNFSVTEFLDTKFPDENSLGGLDDFISEMVSELGTLDAELASSINCQVGAIETAPQQITSIEDLALEVTSCFNQLQRQCHSSQETMDAIVRDISALETGKQNLSYVISSLKQISLLATTVEGIRKKAKDRWYRDMADLLFAAKQLSQKLDSLKDIPPITELFQLFESTMKDLRCQLMEDFDSLLDSDGEPMQNLLDAAKVVDAISVEFRRQILSRVASALLSPYQRLFNSAPVLSTTAAVESLDGVSRRFAWLRRMLRDFNHNKGNCFPISWNVESIVCERFCKHTRSQLVDILGRFTVDVNVLVRCFQTVRDFERQLDDLIRGVVPGSKSQLKALIRDLEDRDSCSIRGVTPSPPPTAPTGTGQTTSTTNQTDPVNVSRDQPGQDMVSFVGFISDSLEAYLTPWTRMEEKALLEAFSGFTDCHTDKTEEAPTAAMLGFSADAFGDEEDMLPRIFFSSAVELLGSISASLQRAVDLASSQCVLDASNLYKGLICNYAEILRTRLPRKAHVLQNPGGASNRQLVCTILGTVDYVERALPCLAARLAASAGDAPDTHAVNFDDGRDLLWNVKSEAMNCLSLPVQVKIRGLFDEALEKSRPSVLKDCAAASDSRDSSTSELVDAIRDVLHSELTCCAELLNSSLLRLLRDSLAAWLLQTHEYFVNQMLNAYRNKEANSVKATEKSFTGTHSRLHSSPAPSPVPPTLDAFSSLQLRQLATDTVALKKLLLDLPVEQNLKIGSNAASAVYQKSVVRQLEHLETAISLACGAPTANQHVQLG